MPDPKLQALYGLKYNPFLPAIPVEDLWRPPGVDTFFFRVETLLIDGGFALLTGDPGLGKSKVSQLLAHRLAQLRDVVIGVMERPQSALGDFYRELGELFGVDLKPANRYGGFKALRARWRGHVKSTLFRPVLLIDEAQEVDTACLSEIRLLGSANFDSECLLTTVLCGDSRLPERFRARELLPLGSRTHTRLVLEPLSREDMRAFLDHLLDKAGAPHLMSEPLKNALAEHSAGNPRVLTSFAAELLAEAAARNLAVLDEQLYMDLYAKPARLRKTPPPRPQA